MAAASTENLKVRHKKYTLKFKKEVAAYANENSIRSAAEKFGIHRKSVQEWKKRETQLIEAPNSRRFRLDGNGRKVRINEVETGVLQFFNEMREKKLRITRARLRNKAMEIYNSLQLKVEEVENKFVASEGWVTKFLERNGLTLRRSTTVCQKPSADYVDKILTISVYVKSLHEKFNFPVNCIIDCDETATWYDALTNSTVATKGYKEVAVPSTVHSKNRIVVMLIVKGDGITSKPNILLPRKRPMPNIIKLYGGRVVIKFKGTNWKNQQLAEDYLNMVVAPPMFTLKVIPGGCTGFIQAPSLKVYGLRLTKKLDQSEDDQILVFKEGKCCSGRMEEFTEMLQNHRVAEIEYDPFKDIITEDSHEEDLDEWLIGVVDHERSC